MTRARGEGEDKSADTEERAKTACLRLLSVRARSRKELKERLEKKGFSASVISSTLTDLQRVGLVDDNEFARMWVEERLRSRPSGARVLKWQLRRHGIHEELANSVIEKALDSEKELGLVIELAQAKLRRLHSKAQPGAEIGREELARIGRFLASRGFSFDVIKEAFNNILEENAQEES
jgi:regulatory protein